MKTLSSIILFCFCWNLQAQNNTEDLISANKEIYLLTDSLWNLEKQYINRSIDEQTYLKISGELLNAISALAYSNASNYTRQLEEMNAQDGSPQVVDLPTPPARDPQDTLPSDNMEQMPDFNPPGNPIDLITGSGRRTSFKLRYGMFWNGLSQGTKNSTIEYPKFKLWSSYCWFSEFDILLQTRLGTSNRGPFSIYYGIGWDIRKYTQKENPQQLTLDQDKASFELLGETLDKASVEVSYFRFPVGLQYKKKKLVLNAGAYVGFLTNHEQTLEYKTSLGEEAELTLDKNYNFSKTNYGLSASLGYKRIHLAFNYDLNTLFKDNDDYKYNAWKIGLMIF